MFALGEETVTCLPKGKGREKKEKKGNLSKLADVLFASELRSSVPLKKMQRCLWISEHAAPPANLMRVETRSLSSSG